jgi:hypothetical protein
VLAVTPSPAAASPGGLTAEHAAEHARQAAAAAHERRRLAGLSPRERARLEARRDAVRARALATPPEEGGAWSAPFPHRSYGMHAALLPTGKVIFWSLPLNGQSDANEGVAWLWDPAAGTGPGAFEDVDPPLVDSDGDGTLERAPIWCSGQSFLPDGRLLIAGGNRQWPDYDAGATDYIGWEAVFTFNPFSETWARQPDMAGGRWYPSQVLTGDGSTYIASGYDKDPMGGAANKRLERFLPSPDMDGTDGVVAVIGSPTGTSFGLYPHLFALPDGKVAVAGPIRSDVALLDTATGVWDRLFDQNGMRPLMSQNRVGGTAVLQPSGPGGSDVVTDIGGWANTGEGSTYDPSVATTETIDFSPASGMPRWVQDAPLNVARANHNTVLLPDGSMVTVGGGAGRSNAAGVRAMYDDGRSRPVELRDAGGGPWRLGAPQAEDRGYHSTALLLPDGRVMSAGDDVHPDDDGDTIELYSPPYLFRGERPAIGAAPAAVGYGQQFDVASSSPGLTRAVLMAPSATTHAADMTQRHVELEVAGRPAGGGLTVRSPGHRNLAPPGYYMLFVLNEAGVPSVSRWVRLDPAVAHPPEAPRPSEAAPRPSPPSDADADDDAGAPAATQPPAGGAPRDGLPPTLRLHVTAAAMRAAWRTGRIRFRVSVDEGAAVEARLSVLGSRRAAGIVRRALAPGTAALTLRVPRDRRRALRGRSLRLAVSAVDAAGNVRRAGFTLRRRRR